MARIGRISLTCFNQLPLSRLEFVEETALGCATHYWISWWTKLQLLGPGLTVQEAILSTICVAHLMNFDRGSILSCRCCTADAQWSLA